MRITGHRALKSLITVTIAMLSAGASIAQDYPTRPIRVIAPGVGGVADVTARLLAPPVSQLIGQQLIVENRASGVIPGQVVASSQPDGYTLLVYGPPVWLSQYLQDAVPYDVVRDLAPITLAISTPNVLAVNPAVTASTVAELLALARSKPGELNYGSNGNGSSGHLAAELLKSMASINIVKINYKSGGAAIGDLMVGRVQLYFAPAPTVSAQIKAGKLKAIAIASAKPSALTPGLPTVAATIPGYVVESTTAVFARAGTPAPILNRLNQAFVRALNTAAVKEKFFSVGSEVVASTPEELAAAVKVEMDRFGKLIKDAGIRNED